MQQSPRPPKWAIAALFVLSFLGFVDTSYLTLEHYLHQTPRCILFSGCDLVTTSAYSTIGPVPIALLGFLFYLSVFFLMLFYVDRKKVLALKLIALGAALGFVFTLYLVYLQLFVLHAICIYCMFSALTSTCIALVSGYSLLAIRNKEVPTDQSLS